MVETDQCQITYCKGCRTFTLVYKSSCANFTFDELEGFKHVLEDLGAEDYFFTFCDRQMAIVKSPRESVGFCLAPEDVVYLLDSLKESLTLFDAFQIIYS